jgi:hypothetical protein
MSYANSKWSSSSIAAPRAQEDGIPFRLVIPCHLMRGKHRLPVTIFAYNLLNGVVTLSPDSPDAERVCRSALSAGDWVTFEALGRSFSARVAARVVGAMVPLHPADLLRSLGKALERTVKGLPAVEESPRARRRGGAVAVRKAGPKGHSRRRRVSRRRRTAP